MASEKVYRTSDLDAAAWCLAKGHRLLGVDISSRPRSFFVLNPEAASCVSEYHAGGTCIALDFAQALRELKAALHSPSMTNPMENPYARARRAQ